MANKIRTCRWVIEPADNVKPAVYCGKPTTYKMEWDGGEEGSSKVRNYDILCPEHRAVAELQDEEDE